MKAFAKLLMVGTFSLLVSANIFGAAQAADQGSETITVVYSGDIQGNLLPTKI